MSNTGQRLVDRFRVLFAKEYRGPVKRIIKLPLSANDAAGGLFTWRNDLEGDCVVNRVTLDVTTPATAACSVEVGSASTAVASANLIDALDVHTAAGTFDNVANPGTNGKGHQKVPVGQYVTGSTASGASAGLVGAAYLEVFVL